MATHRGGVGCTFGGMAHNISTIVSQLRTVTNGQRRGGSSADPALGDLAARTLELAQFVEEQAKEIAGLKSVGKSV